MNKDKYPSYENLKFQDLEHETHLSTEKGIRIMDKGQESSEISDISSFW